MIANELDSVVEKRKRAGTRRTDKRLLIEYSGSVAGQTEANKKVAAENLFYLQVKGLTQLVYSDTCEVVVVFVADVVEDNLENSSDSRMLLSFSSSPRSPERTYLAHVTVGSCPHIGRRLNRNTPAEDENENRSGEEQVVHLRWSTDSTAVSFFQ